MPDGGGLCTPTGFIRRPIFSFGFARHLSQREKMRARNQRTADRLILLIGTAAGAMVARDLFARPILLRENHSLVEDEMM